MMRHLLIIIILLSCNPLTNSNPVDQSRHNSDRAIYNAMYLADKIDFQVFQQAIKGFHDIDTKNKALLTIIDFSKFSTEERFFVLDMEQNELLYSSYVSHGRNSGGEFATAFSNVSGSYQSSLGFYLTEGTYQGKNGYSLILQGLEKGINDKAKERAIVIHGANYANPEVIKTAGRLGRSLGCPALPQNVAQPIIDKIKEGSLLFIYADNEEYAQKSTILSHHSILSFAIETTL